MIEIKEIQIDAKDLNKNNITAPLNESNIWKGFDNQADMQYIKECAENVGMDVTDRTAFSISFIAEVIRRMNKFNRSKEVYNKGYDDGREAIAFHYELCKEEGSIITVSDGATNGDMMLKLFLNSRYKVVDTGIEFKGIIDDNTEFTTWFPIEWWNAPYGEKEPTVEQGLSYTDESGLQSAT